MSRRGSRRSRSSDAPGSASKNACGNTAGIETPEHLDAPTLRPLLNTFGTAMPGYSAGHFRLRDRSRGFLLLTDRRKVLALPERGGRTLLLSLERPQALLDALQAVAAPASRR